MDRKPSKLIYYKSLLFVCGLLITTFSFGQTEIGYNSNSFKTNFKKKLIFRMDLVNDIDKVEIFTKENKLLKFTPNESVKLKLNALYDFLNVSYAYTPSFFPGNNDDELKGKTTTKNFGVNLFFNRFFGRANINKTTGYYVENTEEAYPNYPEKFITFENLERKYIRFEIGYNMNPNFSYKSYLLFNEVQLQSAGSFIPRLLYSSSQYTINEHNINQNRTNKQVTVTGNYIHTFVIKKNLSITAGFGLGIGVSEIEDNNLNKSDPKQDYSNATGTGESIFQCTYQKNNLFIGLSSFSRGTAHIQEEIKNAFKTQSVTVSLFVGYRFKAPKALENTFTGIKGLLKKKAKPELEI